MTSWWGAREGTPLAFAHAARLLGLGFRFWLGFRRVRGCRLPRRIVSLCFVLPEHYTEHNQANENAAGDDRRL